METKKPKRMDDGQRASIRSLLDGPGTAPFSDGWVRMLLADGDSCREEVEALKAELELLKRQEAGAWRSSHWHEDICNRVRDALGLPASTEIHTLPDVLRERLAQRPAVDATSAPLRACVPVPAEPELHPNGVRCLVCGTTPCRNISPGATAPSVTEPELTPEERERLGRQAVAALKGWLVPASEWRGLSDTQRAAWCAVGETLYREGYAAAIARVRNVVEAVKPIDGESATSLGATHEAWRAGCVWVLDFVRKSIGQPPAKPNAEASMTAHAPTQDATCALHERQRAACRSDHRPGPAAMEEAVESLVAKSVAMVERLVAASERIEARVEVVEARFGDMAEWQEGILSRLRGLEERVSVTEAEGARVREQAARTEHALREVVEWLARINRPAPSLAPEVVRARRALGMPETP